MLHCVFTKNHMNSKLKKQQHGILCSIIVNRICIYFVHVNYLHNSRAVIFSILTTIWEVQKHVFEDLIDVFAKIYFIDIYLSNFTIKQKRGVGECCLQYLLLISSYKYEILVIIMY